MTHSQDHDGSGKPVTLYFPSPLRVALPKVTAISLLLISAANIGSFIKSGDWSATSLKIHFLTTLILVSLIGLILLIAYYASKITSVFFIVDHDSLVIVKMGRAREYKLDDINAFQFDSTISSSKNNQRIDIAIFAQNKQDEKLHIFSINHHYRLLGAWRKTAAMLEMATGKNVIMVLHMQDYSDQVVDIEPDSTF
jgi:hypothetical protein